MTEREIVRLEPGFVLHMRPYKNTSQLLDCLTENHGVITLIAQGSRRSRSDRRVVLQPFSLLQLSWIRRGELGRLTQAEAVSSTLALSGEEVLAGFYLNELLLRLMGREDPNPLVFSCYSRCLSDLSGLSNTPRAVRLFELRLLQALGYGIELQEDAETGKAINSESFYEFKPEHGFTLRNTPDKGPYIFKGCELISLREECLNDRQSLKAAKRLLDLVLRVYLGNRPLSTRSVLKDVYARGFQI
ncbi:MAG: DNA repair protein RecO [Rhodospirillaceae bacterium]|nr:DNA repair protein RecO [Rhodospirillaceae bacterium]|tara:strand:- start:1024 stop:1758 length:735 start_codon:yes stop_codon:yes gene_type:complete